MKLFTCPHVPSELRLTKKACAKYYKLANQYSKYRQVDTYSSIYKYCYGCPIGKINNDYYHGKLKNKKQKKICKLYQSMPDACKNKDQEGAFHRENRHSDFDWELKIFCCSRCGLLYHHLKKRGKIK